MLPVISLTSSDTLLHPRERLQSIMMSTICLSVCLPLCTCVCVRQDISGTNYFVHATGRIAYRWPAVNGVMGVHSASEV